MKTIGLLLQARADDFSAWRAALAAMGARAACVLKPHELAYAHGDEPCCARCGYDFAAVWRRCSPWDAAPISDATVLRWYDFRLLVCCMTLDGLDAIVDLLRGGAAHE